MDPFAKPKTSSSRPQNAGINPFAQALAETERPFSDPKPKTANNPFSEALARTGGKFADFPSGDAKSDALNQIDMGRQQEALREEQEKKARLKKRLAEVNPVDQKAVFDARERQVEQQLEETRHAIELLIQDVATLRMDLEVEVTKKVVNPGTKGSYYIIFFQKFRQFVNLIRESVHSASAWAKQASAKHAKKNHKRGAQPGMEFGKAQHEQTKTVFDMMHHERSSTYGGS